MGSEAWLEKPRRGKHVWITCLILMDQTMTERQGKYPWDNVSAVNILICTTILMSNPIQWYSDWSIKIFIWFTGVRGLLSTSKPKWYTSHRPFRYYQWKCTSDHEILGRIQRQSQKWSFVQARPFVANLCNNYVSASRLARRIPWLTHSLGQWALLKLHSRGPIWA